MGSSPWKLLHGVCALPPGSMVSGIKPFSNPWQSSAGGLLSTQSWKSKSLHASSCAINKTSCMTTTVLMQY